MAKIESYKCDVCGKQKNKEESSWFVIGMDENVSGMTLVPFDEEKPDDYEADMVYHLCGSECVIKEVSSLLSSGDLVLPKDKKRS